VLDRPEALARGELEVLGGDVVLVVDEGLDPRRVPPVRDGADEAAGPGVDGLRLGPVPAGAAEARRPRRRLAPILRTKGIQP
jgi:hypothetical protein